MVGKFMQVAANRDYSKWWQSEGSFPWLIQQPKPPIEPPRPNSVRDNYIRCVTGNKPYWMPLAGYEANLIWPDAIEEHPVPEVDGYDWWGVYWIMVEKAGGMITKTGTRTISDFAKWKEELEWPDLSLVDFETDGKKIASRLDPDRPHVYECVEGIFERLHEMIPFDESLIAFYDEPELLEEFFQRMADYKIECCSKIFQYYGRVDGVLYHDDWGSQRTGFFSNEMFREQLFPATKRLLDYIHSHGKFVELHSCGCNTQYVPMMIEMGVNMWSPQASANDLDFLCDTYGKDITFTVPLYIPEKADEAECRARVRGFVDRYGENGRVMASFMSRDQKQTAVVRKELFEYSLAYYQKLFGASRTC